MAILTVNNIKKMFGTDVIIQDITFEVQKGDRIGLVGINGSGKTTLFKVLNGEYTADEGTFTPARETSIGYMEQHVCRDMEKPAFDEVMTVFAPLLKMEAEIEVLTTKISEMPENLNELIEKQAELNDRFIADGGLTCRNRAKSTLIGLGFAPEQIYAPIGVLSGGQKAKIQLAKMLLGESNLLLLDEPTNHLDIPSVEWLEDFLKNYNGSYIVISHDRYFLDAVTNRTFEIENTHLTEYKGNYTKYLQLKEENRLAMQRVYDNTQREIKRIEGIIEQQKRFNQERNYVTIASKQKSIDRLQATLEKPEDDPDTIKFQFKASQRGGNDVLEAEEIAFAKVHVFAYSRRPGTRAYDMGDQLTNAVKEARSHEMIRVTTATQQAFFKAQIGRTEEVLFEREIQKGVWEGYSMNYTPVAVASGTSLAGEIRSVRIESCTDTHCMGAVL